MKMINTTFLNFVDQMGYKYNYNDIKKIKLLRKINNFMCEICTYLCNKKIGIIDLGRKEYGVSVSSYCKECGQNYVTCLYIDKLPFGSQSIIWKDHPELNNDDKLFVQSIYEEYEDE